MILGGLPVALLGLCGCQFFVADADREVYRLIEQRQMAALGQATDVRLNYEQDGGVQSDPYAFVPHPVIPEIPEEFTKTAPDSVEPPDPPDPDDGEAVQLPGADLGPPPDLLDEPATDADDDAAVDPPPDAESAEEQGNGSVRRPRNPSARKLSRQHGRFAPLNGIILSSSRRIPLVDIPP